MRGAVLHAPGDVRVEDRPDPAIVEPTDAIIRLSATCVCGSDLWPYRGTNRIQTSESRESRVAESFSAHTTRSINYEHEV